MPTSSLISDFGFRISDFSPAQGCRPEGAPSICHSDQASGAFNCCCHPEGANRVSELRDLWKSQPHASAQSIP